MATPHHCRRGAGLKPQPDTRRLTVHGPDERLELPWTLSMDSNAEHCSTGSDDCQQSGGAMLGGPMARFESKCEANSGGASSHKSTGGARHSVRSPLACHRPGAHGVTRPTTSGFTGPWRDFRIVEDSQGWGRRSTTGGGVPGPATPAHQMRVRYKFDGAAEKKNLVPACS